MNILLLDMDGVLLESQGYHLAHQETVLRTAESLGFFGRDGESRRYCRLRSQRHVQRVGRGCYGEGLAAITGLAGAAWAYHHQRNSRPNIPHQEVTVPPEVELGARLVELEYLPILGRGNQVWLGKWLDIDPQYFLKLHPLHTLAALQMVLRCPYSKSLEAAAGPGRDEIPSPAWITLNSARVSLYEDTPKGVPSLQAVQEALVSAALESRSKAMVLPASMLSARHWTIL